MDKKNVPLMAMGAAFSFIIMMFNLPVPDGTTAHVTGAALLAVALGPWAATISLTIALVIQALLFGDGGVLALGANCFNIAFIAPFSGYLVYKLFLKMKANQVVASGVGAYLGSIIAALATAVELGLQPLLFHTANGSPLYFPYGLKLTIPAMVFAYLTIAGIVEAIVTGAVVFYLWRVGEESIFYRMSIRNSSHK